jgi:hypothetical protein
MEESQKHSARLIWRVTEENIPFENPRVDRQ